MEHLSFLILFLKLNHRNNKNFPPLVRLDFETKMKLAQTTLSRRDSLKIARRFNAGNGSPCASSPAGMGFETPEIVTPLELFREREDL
jgi:hypothetical protein